MGETYLHFFFEVNYSNHLLTGNHKFDFEILHSRNNLCGILKINKQKCPTNLLKEQTSLSRSSLLNRYNVFDELSLSFQNNVKSLVGFLVFSCTILSLIIENLDYL